MLFFTNVTEIPKDIEGRNLQTFLIENNIGFEYQPSISFEYEYDGKVHTYHPDFKVGDKIFEVKGD